MEQIIRKYTMSGYISRVKKAYADMRVNAELPSIIERAKFFAEELKKWEEAQKPIRTKEQMEFILETHCRRCPHFNGTICMVCGCMINTTTGLNKLYWATTECPDTPKKWGSNATMSAREGDEAKKEEDRAANVVVPPSVLPPVKPEIKKGGCGCGS